MCFPSRLHLATVIDRRYREHCLPVAHGRRRFGSFWRPAGSEQHRENDEHLRTRRVIRAAKERRDIQARIACRLPRDRWANNETIKRIAPRVLVGEVAILHFHPGF